jgi:hypothetical protein
MLKRVYTATPIFVEKEVEIAYDPHYPLTDYF